MPDYDSFEAFAQDVEKRFPEIARLAAIPALEEASTFLLEQVPEYPNEILRRLPPPDGVSWLRTDAQRRWFFAAIRAGDIPGWEWVIETKTRIVEDPRNTVMRSYPPKTVITKSGHPMKVGGGRTGNLGRAQGFEIVTPDESVIAILGFDKAIAPYAPWVVGLDFPGGEMGDGVKYQARIHVDRWWQFAEVIDENIEDAWKKFDETFWDKFNQYLNKG